MIYNKPRNIKAAFDTRKFNKTMDKLDNYIDHIILYDNAKRDQEGIWHLAVEDLPKNELANLVDLLMQEDTSVRDFVLHECQKLINARLDIAELKDRYAKGQEQINTPYGNEWVTSSRPAYDE